MPDQANELAARRWWKRRSLAVEIALENYGSDDIEIYDESADAESHVEEVDGGYWIRARVWVAAAEVEGKMGGD
jgi:hypothetical protein